MLGFHCLFLISLWPIHTSAQGSVFSTLPTLTSMVVPCRTLRLLAHHPHAALSKCLSLHQISSLPYTSLNFLSSVEYLLHIPNSTCLKWNPSITLLPLHTSWTSHSFFFFSFSVKLRLLHLSSFSGQKVLKSSCFSFCPIFFIQSISTSSKY